MFGQRVKERRDAKRLTQKDLAELVGVTKTTVSGWERGTSTPSNQTLVILARVLNTSTDYLLGVPEKPMISVEGLTAEQVKKVEMFIDMIKD